MHPYIISLYIECSIYFFNLEYDTFEATLLRSVIVRTTNAFLFNKTLTGFLTNGFFQASPRFTWSSKYTYVLQLQNISDLKVNKK